MKEYSQIDPFSGLNEAIKNLGGRTDIYLKYVKRFQANYNNSFNQINQYIKESKYEEAGLFVHSVKGLAITLGMNNLGEKASALEIAIKKGRYQSLPSLLSAYKCALEQVIHAPVPCLD